MQSLSTKELARIVEAEWVPDAETMLTGVSIDSRTIRPGECFFAIKGERFDGHDYVAEVLDKGAACAVVREDFDGEALSGPVLRVLDTVRALGDLARAYRRMHPFKVVAITGSVGKTTTRQIVHHVLSRHFRVRQAQKSFNNEIGLPLTLLSAEPTDEIIITELGANHPGEIAYLTRIAQPDIAVVTTVQPAHLEGFGDLATITREKLSIAEGLSDDGIFLVNGDIEALAEEAAARSGPSLSRRSEPDTGSAVGRGQAWGPAPTTLHGHPIATFGRSADVDYQATDIACEGLHSTFMIGDTRVRLPLPGPGNIENALVAWAICDQLGVTVEEFARDVEDLPAVSMRGELVQIGSLTVINDCYNANPPSMRNALAMLRNLRSCGSGDGHRRLVFVCGPMAELGSQSEDFHAELGRQVAEAGVDLLVTVGEPTRATARAATEAARHDLQTRHFDDTLSLCNVLQDVIGKDDIILVKGSRTARLERVVRALIKDEG